MRTPSHRSAFLLAAALAVVLPLSAHFTWLSPDPSVVKAGQSVRVILDGGHSFPEGDAPPMGVELRMRAVDPAGRSSDLQTTAGEKRIQATLTTAAEGLYRIVGELDRGVISQTPEGWKPGGRAKYPDAPQSMKSYNSFLCDVRTSGTRNEGARPLGLAFEISWTRSGDRIEILATREGRPVEGAVISLLPGPGDPIEAGTTGPTGRLEGRVPDDYRGPVLITGSLSKPMPAGSDYALERFSSSYRLTWD